MSMSESSSRSTQLIASFACQLLDRCGIGGGMPRSRTSQVMARYIAPELT